MGFSEKVNDVSMLISGMTNDIGERLAIAYVLCNIYKYELNKNLVAIPTRPASAEEKNSDEAQ